MPTPQLADVLDPFQVSAVLESHGALLGRPLTLLDLDGAPFVGPIPGEPERLLRRELRLEGCAFGTLVAPPGAEDGTCRKQMEQPFLECLGEVLEALASLRWQLMQDQEALERSEGAYRRLVNQVHDILYTYRPDGLLTFASDRVSCLGYAPTEVVGRPLLSFVHPEDQARALEVVRRTVTEGVPGRIECRILRADGSYEWCEEHSIPQVVNGQVQSVQGVIRITSDRHQAEEALRRSERRYRTLIESQGEGVAYVDEQENFLLVNPAAEAIFGCGPGGLQGRNLAEFTSPSAFERIQSQTALRSLGIKSTYELEILRPDGQVRFLLVTATPHAGDLDQGRGVLGIFRDITEWREAEASLRRISSAIAQASDAILIANTEGTILYANPAAEHLSGHGEGSLLGRGLRDLMVDAARTRGFNLVWRKVLRGSSWRGRLPVVRSDGSTCETLTTLSPVRDDAGMIQYVITDSRDISREQELEAQLRHSQRLEAIGVLAGGIAHDFNNILTPILGYAELAQVQLKDQPKVREFVDEILAAGRRAAALVDQILTFSRQGEQDRAEVRLAAVVKEALKLLRAAIPATITIETEVGEDAGMVMADPGQLHQVVVNLCTNAFHAMRESGGTLTVRLHGVCLPETLSVLGTPLPQGSYARLEIADTGCGMEEEVRKRIFLPFFTTKRVGEGTGLGLSIVHGIVTSLGGAIDVESHPGRGSTFVVYLPTEGAPTREEAPLPTTMAPGHERILVVDDELMVGAMLRDMLSELGYQVAVLDCALDALQTLRLAPDHWDLVLTDLTMPDMSGLELVQALRAHTIPIPVILMSGYSEGLSEGEMADLGIAALVKKPVPLPLLTRTIRETLDLRVASGSASRT